jgi:alpha-1,4-digalacturonate transport system permease protein
VVPFNYILAMSVVITFLILQRHIVRGIAQTGLR